MSPFALAVNAILALAVLALTYSRHTYTIRLPRLFIQSWHLLYNKGNVAAFEFKVSKEGLKAALAVYAILALEIMKAVQIGSKKKQIFMSSC